jgi:hypothetical protein
MPNAIQGSVGLPPAVLVGGIARRFWIDRTSGLVLDCRGEEMFAWFVKIVAVLAALGAFSTETAAPEPQKAIALLVADDPATLRVGTRESSFDAGLNYFTRFTLLRATEL